uniref:Uncharacterized protein n=1 Tax=Parascaris equorum TaxID=6256 RepID=A0A914RSZ3_PAREQ
SVDRTVDKTTITQAAAESSNQSATGDRAQRWVINCCQRGLRPLLKEFSSIRKFLPKSINTGDMKVFSGAYGLLQMTERCEEWEGFGRRWRWIKRNKKSAWMGWEGWLLI